MKNLFSVKRTLLLFFGLTVMLHLGAQKNDTHPGKNRESLKNLIIREYNSDVKGDKVWLDHETIFNEKGLKVSEIEYTTYGLKYVIKYEYDAHDRCIKDITYDSEEKPKRIRRYEYNKDGTLKKQYNYLPNGRLQSTKSFEYSSRN